MLVGAMFGAGGTAHVCMDMRTYAHNGMHGALPSYVCNCEAAPWLSRVADRQGVAEPSVRIRNSYKS
jgi:hypothetical protein